MKDKYAITKRRQVTLPDEALRAIGVKPGDGIAYSVEKGKIIITRYAGEVVKAEDIIDAFEDLAEDLSEIRPFILEARVAIAKGITERVRVE